MKNDLQLWTRIGHDAGLVSLAILLMAGFCFSQAAISLSPTGGPPTTQLQVSGVAFAPFAQIDIHFDAQDEALATADNTGSFSQIAIPAPASAPPGTHWVSAVERSGANSAQARFTVQTSWRQFHTENMARFNPFENVLNPSNVGRIQLLWNFTADSRVESSPVVVNQLLFVGSDSGNVYALKADTGRLMWSYPTGGPVSCSPAVAINGLVYVASSDFNVYALNAKTGALVWNYPTGGPISSSPAVANGVVYVGSEDANVYALNARTGAKLWSYATGWSVYSSPAVINGVVYVGSDDSNVYALNATTGGMLWSYNVGSYARIVSSPAVANGVVYIGSHAGKALALNSSTGGLLWTQDFRESLYSSPAVAYGMVYMGCPTFYGLNVCAMDAGSGLVRWTFAAGQLGSSPAVASEVVYVNAPNGNFYALNADNGTLLWSYPAGGGDASPAIANGVVYFSSGNNVYAFGLKPGREKDKGSIRTSRSEDSLPRPQSQGVPAGLISSGR